MGNPKKAAGCARCGAVYCRPCVKEIRPLSPLLPLNLKGTKGSAAEKANAPHVCLECSCVLKEARLEARAGGRGEETTASKVSVRDVLCVLKERERMQERECDGRSRVPRPKACCGRDTTPHHTTCKHAHV